MGRPRDMVFGASVGGTKTLARIHPRIYREREHRYNNDNALYTKLGIALKTPTIADLQLESAIKTLRNPIHRVVEFYATTILKGTAEQAFPLVDTTDGIKAALKLLWTWSNLSQTKQLIKRYTAIHGQSFIKVVSPTDAKRVRLQIMKAEPFTDYKKDDYGNIIYARLDTPFERDLVKMTRTEIWRKGEKNARGVAKPGYMRVWEWESLGAEDTVIDEESLGNPKQNLELSTGNTRNSLGFDFVPIVDVSAQETGEKRPRPLWQHALPQIDEHNRQATRQSDLLFRYNKPVKAVVGIGNDASGRPLAPPKVEGQLEAQRVPFGGSVGHLMNAGSKDDMTLGGDILFGLPGNAQLADVTPKLDYAALRDAIKDMADDIRQELPELIYYSTAEKSDLSGVAMRDLLAGAIDRAIEMRANINAAMIKADKMALSIGKVRGISQFRGIGDYQEGEGFQHEFEEPEILPLSELEAEGVRSAKIANAAQLIALGVSRAQALKTVGLDVGEIAEDPEGEAAADDLSRAAAMLEQRMGGPGPGGLVRGGVAGGSISRPGVNGGAA